MKMSPYLYIAAHFVKHITWHTFSIYPFPPVNSWSSKSIFDLSRFFKMFILYQVMDWIREVVKTITASRNQVGPSRELVGFWVN